MLFKRSNEQSWVVLRKSSIVNYPFLLSTDEYIDRFLIHDIVDLLKLDYEFN